MVIMEVEREGKSKKEARTMESRHKTIDAEKVETGDVITREGNAYTVLGKQTGGIGKGWVYFSAEHKNGAFRAPIMWNGKVDIDGMSKTKASVSEVVESAGVK
jgi:hypothetical protein